MKRILILSANPKDTQRLRLDEEISAIEKGLRRSAQRDKFEITSRWAIQTDDLRRALLDTKPHIVHFSGHGTENSCIALENSSGHTQLVSANALAKLFNLFKSQIECVLLNACYSDVQASAIHESIDIVIGMEQSIGDRAAIKFAIGFYDALGANRNYKDAYEFGCSAIDLESIADFSTPVLHHKERLETDGSLPYEQAFPSLSEVVDSGNPKSSITLQKRKETMFSIVIEADENQVNLDILMAALKKLSGDPTLRICKIEKGSIKLILEGSEDAFLQLQTLFESGNLSRELDIFVKAIEKVSRQHKTLIFSDHEIVLGGITSALSNKYPEAEILTASTAQEVREQLSANLPDLLVIDLEFPAQPASTSKVDLEIQLLLFLLETYPELNIVAMSTRTEVLGRIAQSINVHLGGFTIFDKGEPTESLLTCIEWALDGVNFTPPEIRSNIVQVKPEWLELLRLASTEEVQDSVIARRMNVSEKTVRNYWRKVQDQLSVYPEPGINIRIRTLNRARKKGLID